VYVKPEYRRRGVFRQFYAFTQKQVAESSQFCGIRLYVEQNNEAAIATYRSLGMDDGHYRLFEWMP
jgi:ribosomal protein S18 acetylase RimI-like enzyme